MIEIKLPRTLKNFGYRLDFPAGKRRKCLMDMAKYSGRESILFNLSSAMFMTKKNKQMRDYHIIKNDLKWIMKKNKLL